MMEAINVVAIVTSPIVAILVGLWFQRRKEKRDVKRQIFVTLMATRHVGVSDERVRALNMLDLVFHDAPKIRHLWHEYFGMLSNKGMDNPEGHLLRSKKLLEMIAEMAATIGYGHEITHLDVDRVYNPVGLSQQTQRQNDLLVELVRVLKNTGSLGVTPELPAQQGREEVRALPGSTM